MNDEYLQFPFLGSLEDGEPFEYMLLTIQNEIISFAITDWFTLRLKLYQGQKVHLYLPIFAVKKDTLKDEGEKIILSVHENKEINGTVYQVLLTENDKFNGIGNCSFDTFINQIPSEASIINLLVQLIKDCMILKQGIGIYLKHLIPYFSRIIDYTRKEYTELKEHFLHDIQRRIKEHETHLEKLYVLLTQNLIERKDIALYIDLEELREVLESEISSTLFNIVFAEKTKTEQEKYRDNQPSYSIYVYINAIKNLEKRLYRNYNYLVVIYLNSLQVSKG